MGMKVNDNQCSVAVPYETATGLQNLKIALPEAIYTTTWDINGNPILTFSCWKQCVPPANMPEFTNGNDDQRYYENYTAVTDQALPFCTLDRTNFDVIQ